MLINSFNNYNKLSRSLKNSLSLCLHFLTLFSMILAAILAIIHLAQLSRCWLIVSVFIAMIVAFILGNPHGIITRSSTKSFLYIMLVVTLLIRMIWIIMVPSLPVSDFAGYHFMALDMSQLDFKHDTVQEVGYPVLLGILYAVFGGHVLVGKILNVTLSLLTALVLFLLAREAFSEFSARNALILFSLWPAQIMMNSVLASEGPFLLMFLVVLLLLVKAKSDDSKRRQALCFMAGLILGLSCTIRAVGFLLLFVVLAYICFIDGNKTNKWQILKLLLAGFFLVVIPYYLFRWLTFKIPPTVSSLPFNLLYGTNIGYIGMWNPEDAALAHKLIEQYGSRASRYILGVAFSRMISNPMGLLKLMCNKFEVMWSDDAYGAYWSTINIAPNLIEIPIIRVDLLYILSQLYYVFMLCLAIIGLIKIQKTIKIKMQRDKIYNVSLLFVLVIIGFVILHLFIEVQSRYHYPVVAIIILLAGYGITENSVNFKNDSI
ncbi:glycosyltransferase family 39 protein [Neomoorella thermoacetica]|uniref:Glycosyltransferase RgtA/B/C/D-like domain-containing protein n=1 Tax=Moorella thermoacetica (strain ATCC 39073 / JCM 9320) TaxID=264732 RepID=Q2RKP8_MOOTA|nr:glycosyltransferase family 39 protein [Moorella thermoacetica]AKX96059.1 hypothetical protein MOTHA_c07020 [Moorella thermoacetica]OIQ53518.1 hypothetical protein MORE_18700 [Moorella thermoacetica]OIQ55271.1 hypothetical protein MOCA_18430 [Moorella thermoacetica]QCZ99869.1 hypothetical protein MothHH_00716 [Moorella thermoacetica]TYL07477.1 hypothetical protein MOOCA_22420 [Moorella thermoacetica]